MNWKKIIVLLTSIAALFPGQTFAQEKMTLTLEKSVDLALQQNPDYRMAEKAVAKAKAGVVEAYSNLLPQLDASANYQHAWEIQANTIPNFLKEMLGPLATPDMPDYVQIAFGMKNTFIYGASVTQPLFLGGAGVAGVQIANAVQRASEQNLESKKQNLIYQTANAFYLCLLAKELEAVQEEAMGQAQANLDIVLKKYNVGMASGFDKMRAEVEVANLQPELIAAKNNQQAALTQLRTILGLNQSTGVEVSGEFEYKEDDFGNLTLPELQQVALQTRPEMRAMSEQKRITQKGVTIARSIFLPKLFFKTDYSFMAMKNDMKIAQRDFSKGFTSAVSLQIPLFHGFRSSMQYQSARLDHKIMLDTEKQVRDSVAAEVEIVVNKFHEAKQKFLAARGTVDLAKEALRLANLMYDEGANTQLDVLNSQLALTRARLSYANSIYEYQIARYQLRKAVGELKGTL